MIDSLGQLIPGINGATSIAAIRNADDNLAQLRQALADLGLAETTDILIAADHGFSTISKESATSPAAKASYGDVLPGLQPDMTLQEIRSALAASCEITVGLSTVHRFLAAQNLARKKRPYTRPSRTGRM